MPKAFVGAAGGRVPDDHKQRNPSAESRPISKELQRVQDEAFYWALPIYMRILKTIGDAAELVTNCSRKIVR